LTEPNKGIEMKRLALSIALLAAATASLGRPAQSAADIEMMKQQLQAVQKTRQAEAANLANFDDLDFNVYSGQKWNELARSHSKDIVVHYADGSVTRGLDAHIEQLKPMFVFAPDTRIREHPIKIASGDWTAVQGVIEGTFTKPMPTGDGKSIPATGKAFKLTMVTIGRWRGGVMVEEWLMMDNQSFMKQIGLTP
jgi:predicted ester cyclase